MNKIAKVIPYHKMPRGKDIFDYLIPEFLDNKLKIGDLVNIPFGKKTILGAVRDIAGKSLEGKLKLIESVENDIKLPAFQFKLLTWFSEYYYYSLASTFRMIFPDRPKKRQNVASDISKLEKKQFPNNKNVQKTAEIINQSISGRFLLFPFRQQLKISLYFELIKLAIKDKGQILILFPDITSAELFYEKASDFLPTSVILATSIGSQTKNKGLAMWQKVKNNDCNIIVGTRSAIFLPFENIKTIIIDRADADEYKQWDQNPRYDTVTVAKQIQKLTKCQIIISSVAPRIEDAFNAKQEKYQLIRLGERQKRTIKMVDLNSQRDSYAYLGYELTERIKENLNRGKKSLLIVNKRGQYSYICCADCGKLYLCPNCELPMSIDSKKTLHCYRCRHESLLPPACPNCASHRSKYLGIGIEQIRDLLKNEFKVDAQIIGDSMAIGDDAKIILSPACAIDSGMLAQIDFLGFVYIDNLIYLADFSSNHRVYSEIINLAQKTKIGAAIYLQTYFPDNIAIRNLNSSYEQFYKEELAERKEFNYPPFVEVFKLIYEHHDKKVCFKEAQTLYNRLELAVAKTGIKITEPYLYYASKVRTRYRYQIAIFLNEAEKTHEKSLLGLVPDYWTIDRAPKDLL